MHAHAIHRAPFASPISAPVCPCRPLRALAQCSFFLLFVIHSSSLSLTFDLLRHLYFIVHKPPPTKEQPHAYSPPLSFSFSPFAYKKNTPSKRRPKKKKKNLMKRQKQKWMDGGWNRFMDSVQRCWTVHVRTPVRHSPSSRTPHCTFVRTLYSSASSTPAPP